MKESEFGINNEQDLAPGLKNFYYAKSLPAARVDFLLQAKSRIAPQPTQPWRIAPLLQITALTAAAQLRVQDVRSGKECTLYAVKAAGKLRDVIASVESMPAERKTKLL